jgi:hypothetical protein
VEIMSAVMAAAAAIDGMADCAAARTPLSSPAPSAHRCAAAGLDSDAPAERGASMPFDGAVDRLKWARPRMGSAGDRRGRPASQLRHHFNLHVAVLRHRQLVGSG